MKYIFSIFFSLVCIVLYCFCGIEFYYATSNSMYPAIKKGDLLVSTKFYFSIKEGDIIVFKFSDFMDVPFTHRVVSIVEHNGQTFYITKGDNNIESDGLIPKSNVVGKVIAIIRNSNS